MEIRNRHLPTYLMFSSSDHDYEETGSEGEHQGEIEVDGERENDDALDERIDEEQEEQMENHQRNCIGKIAYFFFTDAVYS